ncbi:MAG: DUF3800 domain-containing protein [Calditrichaceae bacterium]|nr:DUF3800 domain-containing protein [Calditrichia bacterium]NUQ43870.1 DUF3800 domain-containing protein [Calditrichaceae bacterium]
MNKCYFFIDESGDPTFYGKRKKLLVGQPGFQPVLLIGMISLTDKKEIRQAIVDFQEGIKNDPLYNSIPSVANPKGWYLHARGDSPDIRSKFVELLRDLKGFKTFVVIGRKRLDLFQNKHNSNEKEFYFDLVYHLLKDRLHDENEYYQVYLSARDKSSRTKLRDAVTKAIERDNQRRRTPKTIQFNCEIVLSQDTPELSIVDYLLWALQRYILQNDGRFYKALIDKYNLVIDLYDFENYSTQGKGKSNYYHRKNPFDLSKVSEFRWDGYI